MKKIIFFIIIILLITACTNDKTGKTKDYPVKPVSFTNVKINDNFWLPRLDTNRIITIPYDFKKCEETHRLDNFAVAGKLKKGSFVGIRYNDSDVYKIIEGAAYSLSTHPDAELEKYLDNLIANIAAAQEDDGYLYTCRTINPDSLPPNTGKTRWSLLKQSHELYNIGHMYEAAVAYYQATGKKSLLNVALKSADLINITFGPGEDQLHGVPGHQEIEIGLIKLFRITGEEKYLKLAKYFLDERGNANGHELYTYGANGENKVYTQDHKPVIKQFEAVGHAVRAPYMYSAMTDIAALTGDKDYKNAVERLWQNVVSKKIYITGGIGSKHAGEAFGENYELPNLTAYNETCAAVANILWNQRLFLLNGDAKYIDVLERTLYNGFLSGVSIHGDKFFYPNPLESDGSHKRSPWFSCSCCPTNVARFLPSLPGYIYAYKKNELFVNLYIGNEAEIDMNFGNLKVSQTTNYPWDGEVVINIKPPSTNRFTVSVRIPGWTNDKPLDSDLYKYQDNYELIPVITINNSNAIYKIKDGYAKINRLWNKNDKIEIKFPVPVRKVLANKKVEDDRGKFSLERGQIVYCAEWIDNGGKVRNLLLDKNAEFTERFEEDMIDGIITLKSKAINLTLNKDKNIVENEHNFKAIPYYAWAHRGQGEMVVWFPYEKSAINPTPPSTIASRSKVTASFIHDKISAVNDQIIPKNSNDHEIPRFTFWNHKGTKEWIQYNFDNETTISHIHIYWFDDGPNGACRIPETWKIMYKKGKQWKEVSMHRKYPVSKDEFNTIEISSVKTKSMRLYVELQSNFSGGIMEWKLE